MAYTPYNDYLGLSTVAWKTDNHLHLEQLMPTGRLELTDPSDELFNNILENGVVHNPLDDFSSDMQEEFNKNGVESHMDEVDDYQVRCRERLALRGINRTVGGRSGESRRHDRKLKNLKGCVFCKNNGRSPTEYLGHVLKDRTGNVSCPVLRKYTCPKCGVSGDKAHTIRYCPKL